MCVTLFGIDILTNESQFLKDPFPIVVTPYGILREDIESTFAKAESPILITL